MNLNRSSDICVISIDPIFISQIKIFSKNSDISFTYTGSTEIQIKCDIFIIDASLLPEFLNNRPNTTKIKFLVHGRQKDLGSSFNAGCADYIRDPWNNDELEARISRFLSKKNITLKWDHLILSNKSITTEEGSIEISIEEYKILGKLLENRGEPVPKEVLFYALWGKYKENSRAVDMHISNIRKKITILRNQSNNCCGIIKTIRNYGYMIY
jgi:DNA-binding response OmpR family regulator